MIYGYVRVSTKNQVLQRQVDSILNDYPEAIIYKEKGSGRSSDREVLNELLGVLKDGDVVVFDEVNRLARNKEFGVSVYFELIDRNVEVRFIKNQWLDSEVYLKKKSEIDMIRADGDIDLIMEGVRKYMRVVIKGQIELAFDIAEKEAVSLSVRVKEGLAVAKSKGKKLGSPKKAKPKSLEKKKKKIEEIKRLSNKFDGVCSVVEVCELVGISRKSFYNYIAEIK